MSNTPDPKKALTGHIVQLYLTIDHALRNERMTPERYNEGVKQRDELKAAMINGGIEVPAPNRTIRRAPVTGVRLQLDGTFTQRMNRKAGVRK